MNKPASALVSVVIPCYDVDPLHLTGAIASVRAQTYPHIEVVVVDDGSTKLETVRAIDALTGVSVVRRDVNGGIGAARNDGIRASRGAFILPVDADDRISEGTVEALLGILHGNDELAGTYPFVRRFGAAQGVHHAPATVALGDLAVVNQVVATCMYRRSDWDAVGGYDESNEAPEDWLLWLSLLGTSGRRLAQVPSATLFYRVRPGSTIDQYEGRAGQHARIVAHRPELAADLYVAAASTARELQVEVAELRAFANAWRPRLAPFLLLRDKARVRLWARESGRRPEI